MRPDFSRWLPMRNVSALRSLRGPAVLAALVLATVPVALADTGALHRARQARPIELGTSGGNLNSFDKAFCSSGTLGSLVQDASGQYILSNNHVLARTNRASTGDDITQPGLIDVGCEKITGDAVADLSAFVPIQFKTKGSTPLNKVDGAIAKVRSGKVDTSGSILDIGPLSNLPAQDKVGCEVQKSGRTTGLTAGAISAVDVTIDVNYGSGKVARYVDQFLVEPGSFSAGGDSGSAIVRAGAAAPRAVGLLFAGSSDFTVGNPIGAVNTAFGVTEVGSGDGTGDCPDPAGPTGGASVTKGRHEEALMRVPGVVGVGVGAGPAIEVYLARDDPEARRQIPARLDGIPVRPLVTGEFVAR